MEKIKIGMVSFEHMHALSYAKALSKMEDVEISGVADSDMYRGTQAASMFNTKYYQDYRKLLETPVDGVVICTCNKLHMPTVIDAAKAHKYIMVEKPFATNTKEADAMLKACRDNGVKMMTAFPLRFNQAVIEAKKQIDRGDIGDILCITGINHGKMPSGWFLDINKSGGGAIIDHTVHVADLMRWFTGSEVKTVYAETGNMLYNTGIDDCGILNVEFENGVFATIDTSWAHHKNYPIWPEVYMEIIGTKGVLKVDAFKQVERIYSEESGEITDDVWGSDGDEGLMREFVNTIKTGKEPSETGLDGAKAMWIALAAYASSKSHKVEKVVYGG